MSLPNPPRLNCTPLHENAQNRASVGGAGLEVRVLPGSPTNKINNLAGILAAVATVIGGRRNRTIYPVALVAGDPKSPPSMKLLMIKSPGTAATSARAKVGTNPQRRA